MVICHCQAVNDESVRAMILAGARDPDEVARRCGAGSRCGGCLPALLGLLDEFDADASEVHTSAA